MKSPRCPACRWHLAFVQKLGYWLALCPNPKCKQGVVEP